MSHIFDKRSEHCINQNFRALTLITCFQGVTLSVRYVRIESANPLPRLRLRQHLWADA